jgi:uncharacterized membrane protein (UPF0127 family)
MKFRYVFAAVLFFLLIFLLVPFLSLPRERSKISISGENFLVWVARTERERTRGLQNIFWLPKDRGMLFIFPEQNTCCFWNKNTFLKLKLTFMREGKIIKTAYLLPIYKGRSTICSEEAVDAVLETPCE